MEWKVQLMPWHRRHQGSKWEEIMVHVYEVQWSDVKPGDIVFIAGNLVNHKPTALYGRHKIIDPDKRILENINGEQFYERWDTLFVEVKVCG